MRQQCFEKFLSYKTESYFLSLAEQIAFDRDEDVDLDQLSLDASDFLTEPCVTRRGEFVSWIQKKCTTID